MPHRICDSVYLVGGPELSGAGDCLVYLVDLGELVLIDCGLGPSYARIADNIRALGLDPLHVHTLLLTHCHADHIGAAASVRQATGCTIVAHAADMSSITAGDPRRTAASWYGITLPPCTVDQTIDGPSAQLTFAAGELTVLHTPGHTPGSVVAVCETPDDHRVLFGQDIHGPFSADFGSDVHAWRRSMNDLLALDADILCEGHFGVFHGALAVRDFIEQQLADNA